MSTMLLAVLMCVATVSVADMEISFPAADNFAEAATAQMNAFKNSFESVGELLKGDAANPVKRSEIHYTMHPSPGAQVEVDMTVESSRKGPEGLLSSMMHAMRDGFHDQKKQMQGAKTGLAQMMQQMKRRNARISEMLQRKANKMRKRMMHKIKHGMPGWMQHLRAGPRRVQQRRLRGMWYRTLLLKQCAEAKQICPATKCPKMLTNCLLKKQKQVTTKCSSFLDSAARFDHEEHQAKTAYRKAKHACKRETRHADRHACKKAARKTKRATVRALEAELRSSGDKKQQKAKKAVQFLERQLGDLQQLDTTTTKAPTAAGCKSDDECQSGGDMGGYCKANHDCHCTAKYFATTGSTCKLSCSPTSSPNACCRDDTDCQKDGDTGAYCKSPKANHHTEPGNGTCRCSADKGFKGTYSCKKAAEEKQEESPMDEGAMDEGAMDEGAMDEDTPAWITGDLEAPQGEKDMGGWTMRAYTPEQMARLHVDETGEAVQNAPASSLTESPPQGQQKGNMLMMLGGLLAILALVAAVLAVSLIRKRQNQQAMELRAAYDEAMAGVPTKATGSEDQL